MANSFSFNEELGMYLVKFVYSIEPDSGLPQMTRPYATATHGPNAFVHALSTYHRLHAHSV